MGNNNRRNNSNSSRKSISLPDARTEALMWKQKLRKMEEQNGGYVRCISCGKIIPLAVAEGGHFFNRGIRATELEDDNIQPQCHLCNCKFAGNIALYRINLVKKIGTERVERLEDMASAYKGDIDAYQRLSIEDRIKVTDKRDIEYYKKSTELSKKKLLKLQERQCEY